MDNTAKLWDVESGKEIVTLKVFVFNFRDIKEKLLV